MAKKTTHTLSADFAAKLQRVVGIVLNQSTGNTSTPHRSGESFDGYWGKITSSTAISNGQRNYVIDIYAVPGVTDTAQRIATAKPARNTWEMDNTATLQAGYTITTSNPACGQYTGIDPIPNGAWIRLQGIRRLDGENRHLFTERNIPIVQGAPA
jgi:hypothetical protein